MRFFVLILGARTPPPRIDEPVMKIPLAFLRQMLYRVSIMPFRSYQAAPTTESPMQRAIPRVAHVCGDTVSRKSPTFVTVVREVGVAAMASRDVH